MPAGHNINDALDDCLDRLLEGETVDQCLSRYPADTEELRPLLEVAGATMRAASSVTYRAEARARGLNSLTQALAARSAPRNRWIPWLGWRSRLVMPLAIGLVAALVTTGAAVGASAASSSSVPGEPLYWVKTTRENISLMLPQSNMDRATVHIKLARTRGAEVADLMHDGRVADAERLANRIQRHLSESAHLAGLDSQPYSIEGPRGLPRAYNRDSVTGMRARLQKDRQYFRARLQELARNMPASYRPKLETLNRRYELRYRVLIGALESGVYPMPPRFRRAFPSGPNRGSADRSNGH